MVVNADIKGNPIYFLVGPGSTRSAPDTVHKALSLFLPTYGAHSGAADVYGAYRSLAGTLHLTVDRVFLVSPLIAFATAGLLAYTAWARDIACSCCVGWRGQ